MASQNSNPEMLEILLEHGALLKGSGALVIAAKSGKLANVRFLLARGIDINELSMVQPDQRSSAHLMTLESCISRCLLPLNPY